jgi:hypothetical protein
MVVDMGMTPNQNRPARSRLLILLLGLMFLGAITEQNALSQQNSVVVNCPPINLEKLKSIIEASTSKKADLVFFSGWCSDCALHLKKLKSSEIILVGTFDTRPRIEKIIGKMNINNPCYTDSGIGKSLRVTSVPAERTVTIESLNQIK